MDKKEYYLVATSITFLAVIAAYAWFNPAETKILEPNQAVLPDSIELPIVWGNLGARMIAAGVEVSPASHTVPNKFPARTILPITSKEKLPLSLTRCTSSVFLLACVVATNTCVNKMETVERIPTAIKISRSVNPSLVSNFDFIL